MQSNKMEEKLDRISDILRETENIKEALVLACCALATVIAQGDPKLDRKAFDFVIGSLNGLIPEYRKKMERQDKEKQEIIDNLNHDLMDPGIPIEEIADKYCTFSSDELRESTIAELCNMRTSILAANNH